MDLTLLSELIQQLALAQAANDTAGANGGASTAPTGPAAPAPAPAAVNVNVTPTGAAAGYFRCPNCNVLHPLAVVAGPVPKTPAGDGGTAPAGGPPTVPATPVAGTSAETGSWYSVTRGREVGVFRGWDVIVSSLVEGVPRWRCKHFATEQQAHAHFNRALLLNDVHIHSNN
ncbi:hypothetical protein PLEOSDRAFT_1106161 [Pleurotus ostreatus PC15]|uniref:Ribonuclease H1 N-terminal domain-containing protein n=1 Tax=Pleurotus ostreatus (strain PC15) TaxID=1137138 RepID=A0A067NE21_PLEO1|nr:hypothetical protein PLEOSDRAFT_1106161 [Pleurotus ostreatus PC15]